MAMTVSPAADRVSNAGLSGILWNIFAFADTEKHSHV